MGTPALHGWLNGFEIIVAVTIEDRCWDLLYDEYVLVTKVPGGFVCSGCEREARVLFPTREALWRDHLFEPFGTWIDGQLAPSTGLAIMGEKGRWTAARLIRPGTAETDPHELVPLRWPPSCR